jgi:hypothetical protein
MVMTFLAHRQTPSTMTATSAQAPVATTSQEDGSSPSVVIELNPAACTETGSHATRSSRERRPTGTRPASQVWCSTV